MSACGKLLYVFPGLDFALGLDLSFNFDHFIDTRAEIVAFLVYIPNLILQVYFVVVVHSILGYLYL